MHQFKVVAREERGARRKVGNENSNSKVAKWRFDLGVDDDDDDDAEDD